MLVKKQKSLSREMKRTTKRKKKVSWLSAKPVRSNSFRTRRKVAKLRSQDQGALFNFTYVFASLNIYTRYMLAIHDPTTSSITVLPTAVSPHILTHTVKALKSIPPSAEPSALEYLQARTALGETFGTKKAQAAIRARERNRVDVRAMEGVMGFVMDGIEKGAEGLMTMGLYHPSSSLL